MLVIVGLDYKSTPEEIRERAAFTKKATLETLRTLKESVEEVIILSTCNRSEIYIYTGNQKVGIDLLKSF